MPWKEKFENFFAEIRESFSQMKREINLQLFQFAN